MKYQVLFSLKNNEKIFKTVFCCIRDWSLRVKTGCHELYYEFLHLYAVLDILNINKDV